MKFNSLIEIFCYFELDEYHHAIWFERRHIVSGYIVTELDEPLECEPWTMKNEINPKMEKQNGNTKK